MQKKRGISLIVLVITIIVMIILATAVVLTLSDTGIISNAENATNEYNKVVQEHQDMLEYADMYLEGKLWTQNGINLSKKNEDGSITTLKVGDSVTLKLEAEEGKPETSAEAYSANNYTNWKVLGAENGRLLLVTAENIAEDIHLEGKEGFITGITQLTDICDDYLNETYAVQARSIKVEDLNRITGFNPTAYTGYGTSYSYTSDFDHPLKGEITSSNPVTETNTYYSYVTSSSETTTDAAVKSLLFNSSYWLASSCTGAERNYAYYGLRFSDYIADADVSYIDCFPLWNSQGGVYPGSSRGVRAVVALNYNVIVTKV